MPTPDQVLAYITAGLVSVALFSVPAGMIGSAVEHFGKVFGMPRVEAFGDKLEKFFFDLPGLLGRK